MVARRMTDSLPFIEFIVNQRNVDDVSQSLLVAAYKLSDTVKSIAPIASSYLSSHAEYQCNRIRTTLMHLAINITGNFAAHLFKSTLSILFRGNRRVKPSAVADYPSTLHLQPSGASPNNYVCGFA